MTNSTDPSVPIRRIFMRLAFILLLPLMIFTESGFSQAGGMFNLLNLTGLFFVFAAFLGRAWSVVYIGGRKAKEVFQVGPYSICRHPLYLFSIIGATGFGLMMGSLVLALVMLVATFLILSITAKKEEAFLRAEFGGQYDEYAAKVPSILPKLSLFNTPAEVVFKVSHQVANFKDGLVFLSFIPIATLLNWLKALDIFPTFILY